MKDEMTKTNAIISIIIPTKNARDTIRYTISSIKLNKYQNFQCIIVDDASDDDTCDIIEREINDDTRFSLIKNDGKKHGPGVCRNIGLNKSIGEYCVFVDADDMIVDDYLTDAINAFENDKTIDIFFGKMLYFGKDGCFADKIKFPFTYEDMLRENRIPIFPVFRTIDGKHIGGFDEDCLHFEDWDFWLRMINGKKIVKNDKIYYLYRRGYSDSKLDLDQKNLCEGMSYVLNKHINNRRHVQ